MSNVSVYMHVCMCVCVCVCVCCEHACMHCVGMEVTCYFSGPRKELQ